jgi:superoxide dismutase, Fe-Mn family
MPSHTIASIASTTAPYKPQNFDNLIGTPGFSDKLLKTHFKLYEAYVKNTNELSAQLNDLVKAEKEKTPAFAEMRRRFGWEFNGMRLHEFYFANMGGKEPAAADSPFHDAATRSFGTFDLWKRDFMGTGAMRGVGWAICYQDPADGRLLNVWVEEHNVNHLAGARPVLIMDAFEHAFITDYGTDRPAYIKAFFDTIDWKAVDSRLTQ